MKVTSHQSTASRHADKSTRLLVIEANPDHGATIRSATKQCLPDVTLTLAQTEAEAVAFLDHCRYAESEIPTLILMNLYLPGRETGWYILDKIKTMSAVLGKVPVVLLGDSTSRNDIREAYQRGCSSYLVKPDTDEGWTAYFQTLRAYWWDTATVPKASVNLF